jgi:hypothetical protein
MRYSTHRDDTTLMKTFLLVIGLAWLAVASTVLLSINPREDLVTSYDTTSTSIGIVMELECLFAPGVALILIGLGLQVRPAENVVKDS